MTYWERKAAGVCIQPYCGSSAAETSVRCLPHTERAKVARQRYRVHRRAEGACIWCGTRPTETVTMCRRCAAIKRTETKRRRQGAGRTDR